MSDHQIVIETYLRRPGEQGTLSPEEVEQAVVNAAMGFYDHASNCNRTRGEMKKASETLVFPRGILERNFVGQLTASPVSKLSTRINSLVHGLLPALTNLLLPHMLYPFMLLHFSMVSLFGQSPSGHIKTPSHSSARSSNRTDEATSSSMTSLILAVTSSKQG